MKVIDVPVDFTLIGMHAAIYTARMLMDGIDGSDV